MIRPSRGWEPGPYGGTEPGARHPKVRPTDLDVIIVPAWLSEGQASVSGAAKDITIVSSLNPPRRCDSRWHLIFSCFPTCRKSLGSASSTRPDRIRRSGDPMKVLYFGDVFAKPGRDALQKAMRKISEKHAPDFIVINGENACHGNGILARHGAGVFRLGRRCHHHGQSCLGSAPDHSFHGDDAAADPSRQLSGSSRLQSSRARFDCCGKPKEAGPAARCYPSDGPSLHGFAGLPVSRGGKRSRETRRSGYPVHPRSIFMERRVPKSRPLRISWTEESVPWWEAIRMFRPPTRGSFRGNRGHYGRRNDRLL